MSTIHHRVLVVVGFHIEDVHKRALELFETLDCAPLVSPLITAVNAYQTFSVATSGSKEGWGTCELHKQLLTDFTKWLGGRPYAWWAVVTFPENGRTTLQAFDDTPDEPANNRTGELLADIIKEPARLDADRTAVPKTRLLGHVEVPDDGRAHCIRHPPADTLENVKTGERTKLR